MLLMCKFNIQVTQRGNTELRGAARSYAERNAELRGAARVTRRFFFIFPPRPSASPLRLSAFLSIFLLHPLRVPLRLLCASCILNLHINKIE
jgi:hypothetical protein